MSKITVLMGAPGAGKGTQAGLLSRHFGWPKISTGDILREIATMNTDLGRQVRDGQSSGQLVSDEILAEIVRERTTRADCRNGYILDGFPRTVNQADLLMELAREQDRQIAVVNLTVRRDALIERLSARLICPQCLEIYNYAAKPPLRPQQCDRCGVRLIHRPDDEPAAIARRLDVYQDQTEPLMEYFRARGLLTEMDGEQPVETTFGALVALLQSK